MRWDHLFDDFESQLEHELEAEEIDLLGEEERLRLGRLGLPERFRGMMTRTSGLGPLRLLLTDGARIDLTIGAVGRDWIAGESHDGSAHRSCVIPIAAIASCFPDSGQAIASTDPATTGTTPMGSLAFRLGLAFVLRDLCRRRSALHISTARERMHGTIDRVARDHVDLAEHEEEDARRERAVRVIRMLPLAEIVLIRFAAG